MHLNLSDIQGIQIEHTSRCNCACLQCSRMSEDDNSKVNPKLPITDLTVDDYKKMLDPFDPSKIFMNHCGTYGDTFVSPTFDKTHDYCLLIGVHGIKIMTNGSMRTPGWWRELALRSGKVLTVIFAIDGLEDTNHIYRVGSNFNKIMNNAQAYIDAGGKAEWVFIKFAHNYHQADAAEHLAKEMGFQQFSVKTSARIVLGGISVTTNKNNVDIKDIPGISSVKTTKDKAIEKYGSFDKYVNETPIECRYKKNNTIFIDMCMNVWPCCWLAGPTYYHMPSPQTRAYDHLVDLYGVDFNNLRLHNWETILNHEFYQEYLIKSWESPDERFKRLPACGRTCGDTFAYSGIDDKNITRKKF